VRRRHRATLSGCDAGVVNGLLDQCAATASDVVRRAEPEGDLTIRRVVDVRYIGQGHELQLALPEGPLRAEDALRLRAQFETLYGSIYGVTMPDEALKRIHMQVMWNRLIAVVEEQAQALLHTAFGAITREAGDLSAGVYDIGGRMLAQAVTGTPGHVNTMAAAVRHFLDRFPITSM